jgi:hypothetical protein
MSAIGGKADIDQPGRLTNLALVTFPAASGILYLLLG